LFDPRFAVVRRGLADEGGDEFDEGDLLVIEAEVGSAADGDEAFDALIADDDGGAGELEAGPVQGAGNGPGRRRRAVLPGHLAAARDHLYPFWLECDGLAIEGQFIGADGVVALAVGLADGYGDVVEADGLEEQVRDAVEPGGEGIALLEED